MLNLLSCLHNQFTTTSLIRQTPNERHTIASHTKFSILSLIMENVWMVFTAIAVVVASWLWGALGLPVWMAHAITKKLRAHGVGGPEYKFFVGNMNDIKEMRATAAGMTLDINSHDFIPLVQPHFHKWIPLYGRTFLYWLGSTPNICIADFNLVKQVLSNRTGLFPKDLSNPNLVRLLGKGLVLGHGDEWQRHRRVVHPAFNMDKLKLMTGTMSECARSMMSKWEAQLESQGKGCHVEIELSSQFEELTADVISHTAFGSCYREGKQVFQALKELQFIAFSTMLIVQIPGFRYLPTEKNLKAWKLNKKVRSILMQIIKNRNAAKDTAGYGNNLLGLMLEACALKDGENQLLSMDEIIDECKTFFFAGQETTSHLLTWIMFLLSTHPEWQEKLREEVLRECGKEVPNCDMLNNLKLVNMVILETLRLYSPVPLMRRMTASEVDLGNMKVPKGAILSIPIATINREKEVWGEDANKFNPLRFKNGVMEAANHPNALLSFSMGPRSCIGQNFAMIEAKAVVAMILQRFSFSLSPKYVHSPASGITLRPKYGLAMVLKSLDM